MQSYLEDYMSMIHTKADHRKKTRPEGNNHQDYIQWLLDEVQEVHHEIKEDNTVYLEDELGDILWDYLNVLYYLEQEGKITSRKKVFERSQQKFGERVSDQLQGIFRKDTKARQKEALAKEHTKKYSTEA